MFNPFPDGVYEVKIEREGILPLPVDLAAAVDFREGDVLSLDRGPVSIRVENYRRLLRGLPKPPTSQPAWRSVTACLVRPLTTIGSGFAIPIPAEMLALEPGGIALLQLSSRVAAREVYVFLEDTLVPA